MLVLFNTAYRPGYARNVLRTIFLPVGASNEYRYTIGEDLQISEALVSEVQRQGDVEVLVCFGDRFSDGGYTFYPVRKGRVIGIERSGGRAYFTIHLNKHVAAIDPRIFTERVYELARDLSGNNRLLSLTNGDPMWSKDGRYVFISPETFDGLLEEGEHAWRAASGQLAKAKAFASTSSRQFVFCKCDLIVNGGKKDYVTGDHSPRYEVQRGNDVRLRVHYYYPAQNDDLGSTASLSVVSSDALQVLGSNELPLDMHENRVEFPFAIESGSERTFGSIDLSFSSTRGDIEVVGAREAIALKIYQPTWWWLLGLVAVVVYVVGAICTAEDEKVVGETLKTLAIVAMVLGLGKKLV